MINNAMYSSNSAEWETPSDFFNKLKTEFSFELDVCATAENAKCERFFTKVEDGLTQDWEGVCWMNPPYGKEIGKWLEKAYISGQSGATVVCLIPARTDTKYWHEYCMKAKEIRFVRGRLKFSNAIHSAPFPSAIVVFSGKNEKTALKSA